MFSIYILTYNEELDIAECIESALLSDDIIVVDSLSADRTVEIAQRYPVRVVPHAFESHGKQRTWMLDNVETKYDWVYILEADERMTPELFAECVRVSQAGEHQSYFAAESVIFMNRWIRYSTQYPRYQMRFFQKDSVRFEDYGHTEREVCRGSTGTLQATYPHYTAGKGLRRWIEKHNDYSDNEARETVRQLESGQIAWKQIFLGKSEIDRRHALKNLSHHLPFRPIVRFVYMYFGLGGIRDGRAGLAWCILQMFYEYTIVLKVREMREGLVGAHLKGKPSGPQNAIKS